MSDSAIGRYQSREINVWPLFMYSAPFTSAQITERQSLFGLYAYSYNNMLSYLIDIETVELTNLLSEYNIRISGLTTDEQIEINKIVVERYLVSLDVAIHSNQMLTLQDKISNETADMDAREVALETDRAALATLIAKIEIERLQTEARISVLQAEITEEETRGDLADIEISEKTIELANVELRKAENSLQVAEVRLEVAKIQLRVIEAGIEFTDVELREAEIKERIARTKNDVIRIGLTSQELEIEKAQTDLTEKEVSIAEEEVDNAIDKKAAVTQAKTVYTTSKTVLGENIAKKAEAVSIRQEAIIEALDSKIGINDVQNEWKVDLSELDKDSVEADGVIRDQITESHLSTGSVRTAAAMQDHEAAVQVAEKLAMARVVKTTLTHTIGTAE